MANSSSVHWNCPICGPIKIRDGGEAHLMMHIAAAPPGIDIVECYRHLLAVRGGEEELRPEFAKQREPRKLLSDLTRKKPVVGKTETVNHKAAPGRGTYATPRKQRP